MDCKHENYVPAGYAINVNQKPDIKVQSLYEVFCHDCQKYVNLLTGENISKTNLIHKTKQ